MKQLRHVDLLDRRRELARQPSTANNPALRSALGKTKRWYRLLSSTANAGEYDTVVEAFGGTSITQPGAVRKPAAATAANGLPVATFDGTDVWLQPLQTGNVGTALWWMLFRIKPADLAANQKIHQITAPGLAGSADVSRSRVELPTTGKLSFDIFSSGSNGRNYLTTATMTAAAWNSGYIQWDASKTAECDTDGSTTDAKLRIAINGAFTPIAASNLGTGGVPTALLAATGSAVIGGANDADAPVSPIRNNGQLGPGLMFGDTSLTAAELAALLAIEFPT